MRKLMVLGILLSVLLVCVNVHAVTPYEARTSWVGGRFWVSAEGTGNTVDFSGGNISRRANAVYIKNWGTAGVTMNYVFVNWNGSNTTIGTKVAGDESIASGTSVVRKDTSDFASATTSDYLLEGGESLWLNPWTCSRIEMTANTVGNNDKPTNQGSLVEVLGLVNY